MHWSSKSIREWNYKKLRKGGRIQFTIQQYKENSLVPRRNTHTWFIVLAFVSSKYAWVSSTWTRFVCNRRPATQHPNIVCNPSVGWELALITSQQVDSCANRGVEGIAQAWRIWRNVLEDMPVIARNAQFGKLSSYTARCPNNRTLLPTRREPRNLDDCKPASTST